MWVFGGGGFAGVCVTLDASLGGGVVRSTICASKEEPVVALGARDRGVALLEAGVARHDAGVARRRGGGETSLVREASVLRRWAVSRRKSGTAVLELESPGLLDLDISLLGISSTRTSRPSLLVCNFLRLVERESDILGITAGRYLV